jgi:hypothetical protein
MAINKKDILHSDPQNIKIYFDSGAIQLNTLLEKYIKGLCQWNCCWNWISSQQEQGKQGSYHVKYSMS